MMTLPELKQRLAQRDLDELVELLRLTPEVLVEIATDYIEENFDELAAVASDVEEFQPEEWREPS